MKKLLLLLLISFFFTISNAQVSPKQALSLNYLGESYTHIGVSLWYDYLIYEKEKTKTTRKGKTKIQFIQLKSHNRIGFYRFPKHHNGWLHTTGALLQRTNLKGGLVGLAIVGGYQTTFLNEDIYEINDNGDIERIGLSSHTNFILGLNTRLGKEYFYKNPDNRWGWHISSGLYWARPLASTSQLVTTFEFGTSYKLKRN